MKKPFLTRLLTFGIGGTLLTGAQAATVVTATAANADHPPFTGNAFPPFWSDNFSPANDLLRGLTPAATGNFAAYADMNLATVNDGVLTPLPVSNASVPMLASVGSGGGGTQLIYALSQTSLVSSIRYFGGWTDGGRVDINVTVSFSVDGGLTYTPLIDAAGGFYSTLHDEAADTQIGGMNNGGTTTFTRHLGGMGPVTTYVEVEDDTTAYLGDNAAITHLKFDFGEVTNGWSGLAGLTATGIAVPEPGVIGLAIAGAACGLRRRRNLPA